MIDTLNLRQADALAAGPDNHWRDHHVETLEAPRGKKARYRVCTAFNQHPAHAARGEFAQDRRRSQLTIDKWQGDYLYARRRCTGSALGGYQ